ncbi:MAG: YggU family protein, partial [Deltaproteobacteria bacterium]
MAAPYIRPGAKGGFFVDLWVQPGARRTGLDGIHGERLKVKVEAAAEKGRANKELVRFLAEILGVKRSQIELVAGAGSRRKTIR